MGKNVFANGREISAKADDNKSIAAMPDVALSPPSPPAGPIPIPYPNFSDASKTTDGSKKVKIGGKEVGLKNKSVYKSSKGDEAATRSFGMGVVTHTLSGATKHAAWSFDVKVEGKNVIRFLDLTTHNHGSDPPNIAMTVDVAKAQIAAGKELSCKELGEVNDDARDNHLDEANTTKTTTITTAFRKDNDGNAKLMMAVSGNKDAKVKSNYRSAYQDPVKDGPIACSETEKYNPSRKHDTEPKLIQPEFAKGGLLKMQISHPVEGPDGKIVNDSMPCGNCKKAICIAGTCEPPLNIVLCSKDNEKEIKADELCEGGKPKPGEIPRDPNWSDSTYKKKLGEARTAFWQSKGL